MVEGTQGSHHKEGSRKMSKTITIVAGIDVAKAKLDVAIHGCKLRWQVTNDPAGFHDLAGLLRSRKVTRIGLEATGGYERYERGVVEYLRKAGFNVVVLQPRQVRAFADFILCRAKSDRIDAGLIAACVAHHQIEREPPDPRIAAFADQLTFIEQTEEDIVRIKVRLEHTRDPKLCRVMLADLERLKTRRAKMIAKLGAALRTHHDLARRLDLVGSIDGIGPRTAIALIIRMPELGRMSREQAAALAGLAPFVHDSGGRKGERHIAGGRERLRKSVYSAALPAAFRWNAQLIALYKRLTEAGKPHKLALVACARKLVIFANTVLARGTEWSSRPATS
jgi:transposase